MRNLSQDRRSPGRDQYQRLVFTWRIIIKLSTVYVWLGIKLIPMSTRFMKKENSACLEMFHKKLDTRNEQYTLFIVNYD
jgi:hypothetical protein